MPVDRTTFAITPRAGTIREVVGLSAPLMVSYLSLSMMWVVDTFVMGRVGTVEQGAVGLGGVLLWALVSFFVGTMTVVNILVAQDFGAGRPDLARHVRAGLLLVLPMTAIVLAHWPLVGPGLSVLGVTDLVRPHAETYLQLRLLGVPALLASYVLTNYLRGIGDTMTPMGVAIGANLFNAAATVVLVFGWFGLPALGVAGAALGSTAASFLELALYVSVFLYNRVAVRHGSRSLRVPSLTELRRFLALGVPIGLTWLFEMVAWTAFSVYAGTRPPVELAAHTILFQVTGFCFMPAAAIGIAASTLVGQYVGAKHLRLARRSGWNSLLVGVLYMALVGGAITLFRQPLMTAFTPDAGVIALGASLALIAGLYQPFDGFGIVGQGVLRGAGKTAVPTIVMLGSGMLVFVPLVWILGERQGLGVTGAWLAALAHVVVVSVVLALVMTRSKAYTQPPSDARLAEVS